MFVILLFPFVCNVIEDETSDAWDAGETLSNDDTLREQIADAINARHPEFKVVEPLQVVAESLYGGWCQTWKDHRKAERGMLRRLRRPRFPVRNVTFPEQAGEVRE